MIDAARSALVAGAVFKESVRDRVPYSMVVFAVLLMAASYLIGQLTAGQDLKIIKDLGLAALSIFGLLIAVFIGIGLVSKEVEKQEHLRPAQQAGDARAVHPRQVRRPGDDAGGQPGGDDAGALRGAVLHRTSIADAGAASRLGGAGDGPAAADRRSG